VDLDLLHVCTGIYIIFEEELLLKAMNYNFKNWIQQVDYSNTAEAEKQSDYRTEL